MLHDKNCLTTQVILSYYKVFETCHEKEQKFTQVQSVLQQCVSFNLLWNSRFYVILAVHNQSGYCMLWHCVVPLQRPLLCSRWSEIMPTVLKNRAYSSCNHGWWHCSPFRNYICMLRWAVIVFFICVINNVLLSENIEKARFEIVRRAVAVEFNTTLINSKGHSHHMYLHVIHTMLRSLHL